MILTQTLIETLSLRISKPYLAQITIKYKIGITYVDGVTNLTLVVPSVLILMMNLKMMILIQHLKMVLAELNHLVEEIYNTTILMELMNVSNVVVVSNWNS